ncbi:uncharacterized protein SPPG_08520 [Spizellomyces punctatus DAOM BR117]|uniref:SEC7 domain-containing protein n=1 Tax=Spizellomyces punctatus (strain DAOM BR117) TaxID=645134 RepID=A0A0L0H602_SPIPD|nr:uncharacterized protein SPPG_08520 [Spizellomyces punctatus DAOM BR117]KNC96133.1 hypothetical protein SPPG_08520 [Spizellomyces punctatus DAOM BR117]|eukprot:XP_016604173.1 hypothetical protein SPPG_08520 [Spizellomyces punctatus DAOM BR117]
MADDHLLGNRQRAAAIGFLRRRGTERVLERGNVSNQGANKDREVESSYTSENGIVGPAPSAEVGEPIFYSELEEIPAEQPTLASSSQQVYVPPAPTATPSPYNGVLSLERISVMLRRKEDELRLQKEAEEMNETTFERKLRVLEEQRQRMRGDAEEADRLAQRTLAIGFLGNNRRVGSPREELERRPTSRAEAAVTHMDEDHVRDWSVSPIRRSRTTLGRKRNLHRRHSSVDTILGEEVRDILEGEIFSEPELVEADVSIGDGTNTEGPGSLRSDPDFFEPLKGEKDQLRSGRFSPSPFGTSVPMHVDPAMPMPNFPVRSSSRSRMLAPPKMERAITIPGPLSPQSPLSPHSPRVRPAQMPNSLLGLRGRLPTSVFPQDPEDVEYDENWSDTGANERNRGQDNEIEQTPTQNGQGMVSPPMSPSRPLRQRSESEVAVDAAQECVEEFPLRRADVSYGPPPQGSAIQAPSNGPSGRQHRVDFAESSAEIRASPPPVTGIMQSRKFLHQGRAWQVITTSTVKDRYLFLFSDVLIIAKQLKVDQDDPKQSIYQVKSIMPLRNAQLVLKDERWQYSPRAPSPAVQSAIRKFTTNPIKAIAYLIAKRAFPCTPDAIAHFLHVTWGLSRKQLGRFLGIPEHHDILQGFLSFFPFKNQRLDESLRLFLSSIRLPGEGAVIDAILDTFAKRWYHCNKDAVDYDAHVTLKLVFAIMELNADLHNPYADENNSTTMREFVDRFRTGVRADAVAAGSGVYSSGVPSDVLGEIYESVRREKLEMAELDGDLMVKEKISVEVDTDYLQSRTPALQDTFARDRRVAQDNEFTPPPFPSRLTLKHTSPPILVRIPYPDAHLRIHLHGQDLQFDPPVLEFVRSNVAVFYMRGSGLGRKLVFFTKRGSSAKRYATPQTRQVTIEPAFLRHSFQITFHSHLDGIAGDNYQPPSSAPSKKKYLFAVSDQPTREQWVASFSAGGIVPNAPAPRRAPTSYSRRRTNSSSSSTSTSSSEEMEAIQEQVAIRVLKDYVLPVDGSPMSAEGIVDAVLRNARIPLALGFLKNQGW